MVTPIFFKLLEWLALLIRKVLHFQASILRQIVASPRTRHVDSGLDLCYVTDNIIATSGPSSTYPSRAYRNPLEDLVKFLDGNHGERWYIWEFRAEGTGYPDSQVYDRIRHYPWPDHHPPPFMLIPRMMATMRDWLKDPEVKGRVAVMHCKAGKGRTGTTTCSYLVSEEGWSLEDALKRFTEKRMRPGFGTGVSIPSQLRWLSYVERWAKHGKIYAERPVEVVEVHVFGLREGVKIAIEGFENEGKIIKRIHVFRKDERDDYNPDEQKQTIKETDEPAKITTVVADVWRSYKKSPVASPINDEKESDGNKDGAKSPVALDRSETLATLNSGDSLGKNVILRPSTPILLPTSDINLATERRSRAGYGLTMVTSVAHVWFNCFFEGNGPENISSGTKDGADDGGIFSIDWDPMDGIKGSSRKGVRAFDSVQVVWRFAAKEQPTIITEPAPNETVADPTAADWKGNTDVHKGDADEDKLTVQTSTYLGLRAESADSADVSKAPSLRSDSPASAVTEENSEKKKEGQFTEKLKGAIKHSKTQEEQEQADSSEEDEGINVGVILPENPAAGGAKQSTDDPSTSPSDANAPKGAKTDGAE